MSYHGGRLYDGALVYLNASSDKHACFYLGKALNALGDELFRKLLYLGEHLPWVLVRREEIAQIRYLAGEKLCGFHAFIHSSTPSCVLPQEGAQCIFAELLALAFEHNADNRLSPACTEKHSAVAVYLFVYRVNSAFTSGSESVCSLLTTRMLFTVCG